AVPQSEKVRDWLQANAGSAASILETEVRSAPSMVFDLSVGSTFLGADPGAAEPGKLTQKIFSEIKQAGANFAVGRYDEPRSLYSSPLFGASGDPTAERRTIHLGIDLFVEQGTPVRAPLDGVVHIVANNSAPMDYGPLAILQHETGDGEKFFTLYGHLAKDSISSLSAGQHVARGQHFGRVSVAPYFPGFADPSQRAVWTSLSPDANLLLVIPPDRFPAEEPRFVETLAARQALLGKNLSISYRHPLKIVRGWMQHLYDDT